MRKQKEPMTFSVFLSYSHSDVDEAIRKRLGDLTKTIADFSATQGVKVNVKRKQNIFMPVEYKHAIQSFAAHKPSTVSMGGKIQKRGYAKKPTVGISKAEEQRINPELDLVKQLAAARLCLAKGYKTNLTLAPAPPNYDFAKLAQHLTQKGDRGWTFSDTWKIKQRSGTRDAAVHVPTRGFEIAACADEPALSRRKKKRRKRESTNK